MNQFIPEHSVVPQPIVRSDREESNASNSIIKHPKKLELQRSNSKKVVYFRNEFAKYYSTFIIPVMRLLSLAEQDAKKEWSYEKDKECSSNSNNKGSGVSESSIVLVPNDGIEIISKNWNSDNNDSEMPIYSTLLDEGMYTKLPAHCLLTLACFLQCSVHTLYQIQFIQQVIQLAFNYKAAKSLGLRRAAVFAMHAAVDCWRYMKENHHRYRPSNNGHTPVWNDLWDVIGWNQWLQSEHHDGIDEDVFISAVVEWCVASISSEADEQIYTLMIHILQIYKQIQFI